MMDVQWFQSLSPGGKLFRAFFAQMGQLLLGCGPPEEGSEEWSFTIHVDPDGLLFRANRASGEHRLKFAILLQRSGLGSRLRMAPWREVGRSPSFGTRDEAMAAAISTARQLFPELANAEPVEFDDEDEDEDATRGAMPFGTLRDRLNVHTTKPVDELTRDELFEEGKLVLTQMAEAAMAGRPDQVATLAGVMHALWGAAFTDKEQDDHE